MRRRWFSAGTVDGVGRAGRGRGCPRQRRGLVAMFAVAMLILGSCDSPDEGIPSTAGDPETTAQPSEPVARPTLRLAGEDSGFPSPFTYRRGPGYMYTQLQYETLLWKDASGELLPWLAEGFEVSDDGLTYTFDLRDDVTWQDGEPFTAEDVAFTFSYFEQNQDQISP
ncbi:MAG TPA: ABC transporter substrate-binding protein, partial [Acidimicrobiales bacterium]|nr:ABC transporter substrate-binding protein [Acidimicrobiales bacterium]